MKIWIRISIGGPVGRLAETGMVDKAGHSFGPFRDRSVEYGFIYLWCRSSC